ncbi:MAG: hypothetical protein IJ292_03325 [Clostridia bacterium]|nr:hypothetical protein [Clostridia bacterium]
MKKQYTLPEIEVLLFKSEDAILTASGGGNTQPSIYSADGDIDIGNFWDAL